MKSIFYILTFLLVFNLQINAEEGQKSFLDKANDYFENAKFSMAELFYVKVLRDQPDNLEANFNLGKIYYQQKAYKKAVKSLQMAYDLNPSDDIKFYLATCIGYSSDPDKALAMYNNLLTVKPNNPDLHLHAGLLGYKYLYKICIYLLYENYV